MNAGTNADNPISIQGNYLDQKGISIPKILYRYARIAHKGVQYHESDLNCDVLATYLQLGQPIWVTMTRASYRAAKLAINVTIKLIYSHESSLMNHSKFAS